MNKKLAAKISSQESLVSDRAMNNMMEYAWWLPSEVLIDFIRCCHSVLVGRLLEDEFGYGDVEINEFAKGHRKLMALFLDSLDGVEDDE